MKVMIVTIVLFAATAMAMENAATLPDTAKALVPCTNSDNSWYSWSWTWAYSLYHKELSSGPFKFPTCGSANYEPTTQSKPVESAKKEQYVPDQPTTEWPFFDRVWSAVRTTMELLPSTIETSNGFAFAYIHMVGNCTSAVEDVTPIAYHTVLITHVICFLSPVAAVICLFMKILCYFFGALFDLRNVLIKKQKIEQDTDFTNEEKDILCRRFMKYWLQERDDAAEFFQKKKREDLLPSLLPRAENALHKHFRISGFKVTIPPKLSSALREYLARKAPTTNGVVVYRYSLAAAVARHNLSDHEFQGVLYYVIQETLKDLNQDETPQAP